MNIYIAADHNGFEMKNELVSWLKEQGHTVTDMGPESFDKEDDYPDFGIKVATAVGENPKENYGILLCGSGVGMSVIAGKVPGVRAALIHDPVIAEAAQRDDDINVLSLGASYISLEEAKNVITAWLNTPFSGEERHKRRIQKIAEYEDKH
ncbi:MAG: RpiB/LacA/LacB family sugar-phosphate isomerase [Candidatus Andersenbacteria bacterium]